MNEQWQELKETIVELRDNGGTGTQQEVCKFLANLMDVIEQGASLINTACEDTISRQAVLDIAKSSKSNWIDNSVLFKRVNELPPVTPQPEMGRWSRKTKVDTYDIAGIKTWGIKCQCDRCCFTTIVVEDFGYYKYCPNCGAKMQEVEG